MSTSFYNAHMQAIESEARALQIDVYKHRKEYFEGNPPAHTIDLLEPGVAIRSIGYSLLSVSSIGEYEINNVRGEVAGLIDHGRKEVVIAERFLAPAKRFTAAHELGHAVLGHFDKKILHRDLPFERAGVVRDSKEIDANRFASAYLMPRKIVEQQFRERFILDEFVLTEESAFALCGTHADNVRAKFRSQRQLSQYIAGTSRFNGALFQPLNECFKVTALTMAIRLEELNLVSAAY